MEQKDLFVTSLIALILNSFPSGSTDYCDVRFTIDERQEFSGNADTAELTPDTQTYTGFGVRVLKNGAWGFAASAIVSEKEAVRVAMTALELASASARLVKLPVVLAPVKSRRDSWISLMKVDPFQIPNDEKAALLIRALSFARIVKGIDSVSGRLSFHRNRTWFGSSEGVELYQEITMPAVEMQITAGQGRDAVTRSWPSSHGGFSCTGGMENVIAVISGESIAIAAEEALMLSHAKPCPDGVFTLILAPDQMSLQIHESIGHPLELDRVFGAETNFSGTSFAQPHLLGSLRFGSEHISVCSDPTEKGVLAAYRYDDDGVQARPVPLISGGIMTGYLSGRETAGRIHRESSGNNRAAGWSHYPINRMSNTRLEPGKHSMNDLLADVENGVYMATNKSWTIDDRRDTFRFECEIAREVKGGKPGRVYRNPVYSGRTLDFWRSCDAVGDASLYQNWGTPACGKGEPAQTLHTSQGSSPARFRNVSVTSSAGRRGHAHG